MYEDQIHNSPDMFRDGWNHQSQSYQSVKIPRCSNADVDWYVRMPTDPPLFDPKVEMLPELFEREGATLEPTFPMIDSQLVHWDRYICMLE